MPLTTGQILNNRYRIVKLLGQGGFGAVYRAWDINLERPRALKENLEMSPEAQRQFKREAQILSDVEHPNLPRVVDHFVIPGQGQYLVMDYVEGQNLQERLESAGGPLPVDDVLAWISQVCEALEYLHGRTPPVIHRDIKPANIRITPPSEGSGQTTGKAKLVDFGIAKVYDPQLRTTLGARAVTPGYSPPEQYGMGITDAQSDIYALGATLYNLLTGQEPPASVDVVSGNAAPPAPADRVNPKVPAAVGAAIEKAMQLNRATRCGSVREFRLALASTYAAPPPARQRTGTIQVSGPMPVERRPALSYEAAAPAIPRHNSGLALAGVLGLIVLAAGIFGVMALFKNQPAESPPPPTTIAVISSPTPQPTDTAMAVQEPEFIPLSVSAPNCDYGGAFAIIQSIDRKTVKFILCRPDPAFLSKIASPAFSILPSEYLENTGGGGALLEKPIGTGPFKFESWNQDESLSLAANDGYWGEKPTDEKLVFYWESDAENRLTKLVEGAVDGIDSPPVEKYAKIQSDPNLILIFRPGLNIFYIGMNNTYPPYDDERVRLAVALGIDRQLIVDKFFPPGSEAATHFTPCNIPNGCAGEPWYQFDPEKAKKLLADAGYPDGFNTELAYREVVRPYLPEPGVVAQEIAAQLKANLNIQAEIKVMESGAFLDAARFGKLPGLHFLGWSADYPDMTAFLDIHFGEAASDQFGSKFLDLTDMLKKAASLSDTAAREPIYSGANKLILIHVPMIPMAHTGSALAFSLAVLNPQASPMNVELFSRMSVPGRSEFKFLLSIKPFSLYCADETENDIFRVCGQVTESLYRYAVNSAAVEPSLAEKCEPNEDMSVWHCYLRQGVKFHDGSTLDANDVVLSYAVQWDASHPLHKGNSGKFSYWTYVWGNHLNAP